ncbi:FAD-dependent oxidoreductase [Paracoccus sp. DMF-8]|uniref:NAD(P)/FAD-dependent oxidoreductase n=1 Tax=Paracoccus sp. DMF-8 TaxID=3019445 RepID=UPI0023E43306|nr:FAD-dependent oxidoreductase [Paracoccus sp. DMF-8]MDF3608114.1 FAD-dependent oxidoreductase [Paracoccus sp. DMF-8]
MSENAPDSVVAIGAGQAASQLAISLRQGGYAGRIVLIGDEPFLPYSRPPLSKAYFKDGQPERLLLRKQDFYDKNAIEIRTSARVVSIDRDARQIRLAGGEVVDYGHLVLATGARNRVLSIPGADLAGVLMLRGLQDADRMRSLAGSARHVAIIGGGFIGLEAAAVFRAAGLRGTLLEAAGRLMARAVSPQVSDHFLSLHRAAGADIHLQETVRRILPDAGGKVAGVELGCGTIVDADAVLIAAGIVPNDDLARDAGLRIDNGIVTDCFLATSDPAISAIGDCANVQHGPDGPHLRLESVQAAVDQAKNLAARLLGQPEPYRKSAWFWSDQGTAKLQIAGLRHGADRFDTGADPDAGKLIVRSYRGDRLVCVETVNMPAEHMRARRDLESETAPA